MAITRVRLGKHAKLYYNTGTSGEPVWTEITTVTNVTLTSEFDETDITCRRHGGQRAKDVTILERNIEFDFISFEGDTVEAALEGFHDAETPKEYLALNGSVATVGKKGIRGTFLIKNWPEEQSIDGHITRQGIQLIPADAETMPVRYTVPSPG